MVVLADWKLSDARAGPRSTSPWIFRITGPLVERHVRRNRIRQLDHPLDALARSVENLPRSRPSEMYETTSYASPTPRVQGSFERAVVVRRDDELLRRSGFPAGAARAPPGSGDRPQGAPSRGREIECSSSSPGRRHASRRRTARPRRDRPRARVGSRTRAPRRPPSWSRAGRCPPAPRRAWTQAPSRGRRRGDARWLGSRRRPRLGTGVTLNGGSGGHLPARRPARCAPRANLRLPAGARWRPGQGCAVRGRHARDRPALRRAPLDLRPRFRAAGRPPLPSRAPAAPSRQWCAAAADRHRRNYDCALERAFDEAGEPYDVVSYIVGGTRSREVPPPLGRGRRRA